MAKSQVSMTVNGKTIEALVEPRTLLIHFLRDQQNITGPHIGCETSHCGACTVDLDGKSVKSCTVFAVQANGADIRTIEGMANADGTLHALQEGFREMHGLQCGFCTPGMITRAYRLLQENKIRPRRKSASASPAICAAAPAIRTSSKPFNSPPRSSTAWHSRRPQNERHDPHLRRTRRQARRHGLQKETRRGHPFHPGQRQLRRRLETAGHALRRLSAFAARPRPHQEDRHDQGRGGARRCRGDHRGDAENRQPGLDADARRRRANGAGRRQSVVPEPGSRFCHRGESRGRGRRCRTGRSRIRGAPLQRRSAQGDDRRRADDPRGPEGQDRRRARQAQALQPHLLLAGWRQGRDRCGLCQSRRDDQGVHRLSALSPVPARDLSVRRLVRQDQGRTDAVGYVSGSACHPHGRLADFKNPRAQDPCHRPRHRRRFRQQGRRLFGLHLRHRRLDRDRTPGEMGRGPHRESLRPRPSPATSTWTWKSPRPRTAR